MSGADPTPAMSARVSTRSTLTIAGVLVVVAILGVAIAIWSMRPPGQATSSDASGAASAEASATPAPSAAPSATTASESGQATASAEPPSTPAPFDQWTEVATFPTDGHAEEVDGLAYAAGQFIAIGHREPLAARGAVGPSQRTPVMWSSPDGRDWSRVELDDSFAGARLLSVVASPAGDALVYGYAAEPGEEEANRQTAWHSTDGASWDEVALTLPGPLGPFIVAGGAGYATTVTRSDTGQSVSEVWHSADAITWVASSLQIPTPAEVDPAAGQDYRSWRDLAAGEEGFVAAMEFGDWSGDQRIDTPLVFASADGRAWIEAEASELPEQPGLLVAAVGGNWVLTATDFNTGETTIWWSANGLDWEQRTSVEVPAPPDLTAEALSSGARPIVGDIVGAGRGVILSGLVSVCCHAPWWAAGVWSSVDAQRWDRLDLPADAVVTNAAHHDGVTVLAGHTGASPEAEWKAVPTFWINDDA